MAERVGQLHDAAPGGFAYLAFGAAAGGQRAPATADYRPWAPGQ